MGILDMLIRSSPWNPNAHYLAQIYESEKHPFDLVSFIFDKFWKYFVVNLSISVPSQEMSSRTEVKKKQKCGKRYSDVSKDAMLSRAM